MRVDSDRLNRTASMGEVIGDAFRLVPCKCRKCGTDTTAFASFLELALCEDCDAAAIVERRKEMERDEIGYRRKVWTQRNLPFTDTILTKLPNPAQAGKVLAWQYGAKGLVLHGLTGQGKSRATLLLLERLYVDEGYEFEFIRTPAWAHDLDAAPFGQHRPLVTRLFNVPLVVFDDVGKEKPTERGLAALFDVLDARTSRNLPVILTTNYPGDKLQSRLAERDGETAAAIMRRIREFCTSISFAKVKP